MKFLSKEDLFGSSVPKPYINKITLESVGFSQPPKISNPHILDPKEPSVIPGIVGASTQSRTRARLKVSLDLIIKDSLQSVPMFRGDSLEIRKYIDICVVECSTGGMASEVISRSQSSQDSLWSNLGASSDIDLEVSGVKKKLSDIMSDKVTSAEQDEFGERNERLLIKDIPYRVSFDAANLPFQPDYLSYIVWTEFDIEQLGDEFEFDSSGLGNLLTGMTVRSRLVHDLIINAGKIVEIGHIFRTDEGAIWTGDVTDIGEGKWWTRRWRTSGETTAYDGPVHQMPDGQWMTGDAHNAQNSKYVTREIVKRERFRNNKIQDFRQVERLEKINLNFSYLENHLTNNVLKTATMLSTFVHGMNTKKYFSDMFLTRDTENNCRFFFGFRKDKIFQDLSPLRALYQKQRINTETYCPIISLKVYRVRTKGSSETGSPPLRPHQPFSFGTKNPLNFNNQNEYEGSYDFIGGPKPNLQTTEGNELIIEYLVSNNAPTINSVDGEGSLIQKFPNLFTRNEREEPNTNNVGVTYFSGVDNSIKHKTDGYYQYKISIEIKDGAPDYLYEQYNTLSLNENSPKENLKKYYEDASKLGTSQIKNFTDDPHIGNENSLVNAGRLPGNPLSFSPGETRPGNFDVALNRFTREFVENSTVTYGSDYWSTIVNTYISVLRSLGGQIDTATTSALINYIHPQTGNIEGIIAVMKLIENLEGILLKGMKGLRPVYTIPTTGAPESSYGNKNPLVQSKIEGQHPPRVRTVKIEHQFDSTFNANLSKNIGLDIFGLGTPLNQGIRIITDTEFQFITDAETQKIFQPDVTEVPKLSAAVDVWNIGDSLYSYFTPSIVKTSTGEVDLRSGRRPPGNVGFSNSPISLNPDFQKDVQTSNQVSMPVTSFMASNYNLTVVKDPEPEIPVNPPGYRNKTGISTPEDQQDLYFKDQKNYKIRAENSTVVFSEILDHLSLSPGPNSDKVAMRKMKKDLSSYSKDSPGGYYDLFFLAQSVENLASGEVRELVYTFTTYRKLPNPLKALFTIANAGSLEAALSAYGGPGNPLLFQDDITNLVSDGPWSSMAARANTRYKFEVIYTLEYFKGWKNIIEGFNGEDADQISLREQGWAPLDEATYTAAASNNSNILCRLKQYSNPLVGMSLQEELPLFEQFFIVSPSQTPPAQTSAFAAASPITTPGANFSSFIRTDGGS